MNAISTLWQWAARMFGHSEHSAPAPWHTHITVLSTAALADEVALISKLLHLRYSIHTLLRRTICQFICFPIRHTANIHQASLCGGGVWHVLQPNRQSASRAVPSALTNPGNSIRSLDAWGRRGEVPAQVIQFGTCTDSSSHLEFPHQWSWGRAGGARRRKGEPPLYAYLSVSPLYLLMVLKYKRKPSVQNTYLLNTA